MAGKFEFCQIIECCENTWMLFEEVLPGIGTVLNGIDLD